MAVATEDLLISPQLQRRMAQRAGSTVIEIKNGHMLPMTNPDEVAEVIIQAAEAISQYSPTVIPRHVDHLNALQRKFAEQILKVAKSVVPEDNPMVISEEGVL